MGVMKFTEDHEWIRVDDPVTVGVEATVGITDHAQTQLGDIVFVELPEVGRTVAKGGEVAVVESVKAASEVYAPVDGKVTAVNAALADEPARVNAAPEGDGWFFKFAIAAPAQLDGLMDADAYHAFIEGTG